MWMMFKEVSMDDKPDHLLGQDRKRLKMLTIKLFLCYANEINRQVFVIQMNEKKILN